VDADVVADVVADVDADVDADVVGLFGLLIAGADVVADVVADAGASSDVGSWAVWIVDCGCDCCIAVSEAVCGCVWDDEPISSVADLARSWSIQRSALGLSHDGSLNNWMTCSWSSGHDEPIARWSLVSMILWALRQQWRQKKN